MFDPLDNEKERIQQAVLERKMTDRYLHRRKTEAIRRSRRFAGSLQGIGVAFALGAANGLRKPSDSAVGPFSPGLMLSMARLIIG